MNELVIPLLIITAVGLIVVLAVALRQVEAVNKVVENDSTDYTRFPKSRAFLKIVKYYFYIPVSIIVFGLVATWQIKQADKQKEKLKLKAETLSKFDTAQFWAAPDPLSMPTADEAKLVIYGRDLIAHTADYLGPQGIVKPISNGMNCQNCHLDAGSKVFGNNYLAVASTYPKFRARSGTAETIAKRVNDCFERSLNGQPIDSTSREMKAIIAYIEWLGETVPKGKTPKGSGLVKLPFLSRAANPDSGRVVYAAKCQSCHGEKGEGLPMPEGNGRHYPPLWGDNSYNQAAGLFRVSTFAGYVKANMPLGATHDNPQLTDAEAWDLAAFVNSQARPKHPFLATDWPKIEGKPFDHPFGPFSDTFPEIQHKLGPFPPIIDFQKRLKEQKESKVSLVQ